jgi:hypothetical protein
MSINLRVLFLLATTPLLVAGSPPTKELEAVPEVVGMRYCYDGDAELFSVWLKLRVQYINRTTETLILDREIGKLYYQVKVAQNVEDLAARRYEYNPNIDWVFSDKDTLPEKPKTDSVGSDFVVLAPGQAFESEINPSVFAYYGNAKDVRGSIRAGRHVLQMDIAAWTRPGEASEYAKSWRKFGRLVTGVVKTNPVEIRVASNPSVEQKCE